MTTHLDHILSLVRKHLGILHQSGMPLPHIVLAQNLGAKNLGVDRWTSRDPLTTTITLQKSILADDKTLERVVAHEVVHHVQHLTMSVRDIALLRARARSGTGHGPDFLALAARINTAMGDPTFVTVTSDQTYEKTANTKPFLMLIGPVGWLGAPTLGYAWAVRLSDKGLDYARKITTMKEGYKVVVTTDETWVQGPKIGTGRMGLAVPREPARAAALRHLYEQGKPYTLPADWRHVPVAPTRTAR